MLSVYDGKHNVLVFVLHKSDCKFQSIAILYFLVYWFIIDVKFGGQIAILFVFLLIESTWFSIGSFAKFIVEDEIIKQNYEDLNDR